MPKKGRPGAAPQEADDVQVEQPKSHPSGKKKKPVNEIDLIFAGKKRKKQSQETTEGSNQKETSVTDKKKGKKKKRSLEEEERRSADTQGKPRRRKTADGLTIYTAEEVGISEGGGGTALCPFDCDCCY